jgi:hypothetical protein
MPMLTPDDHAEADVESEFCHYCMMKGEFVVKDRAGMKDSLTEAYMTELDIPREEAEEKAEETIKRLKRWQ